MKVKFLGTGAAEGYPACWCQCENCKKARSLGGRNRRRNSSLFVEPDLLIDLPAEIFLQADLLGVDLLKVRHLLVTHSHKDHFYPYHLRWRYMEREGDKNKILKLGPRFSSLDLLTVYGTEEVCKIIMESLPIGKLEDYALKLVKLNAFNEYTIEDFKIISIQANHPVPLEMTLNYIIRKEGKCLLYALDSDWFLPESYNEISKHRYDLVVIEGTGGLVEDSEAKGHFNFSKVRRALNLFRQDGLLKPNVYFVISHLSPHHSPPHDEIAPSLAEEGITVAYDGLELTL